MYVSTNVQNLYNFTANVLLLLKVWLYIQQETDTVKKQENKYITSK